MKELDIKTGITCETFYNRLCRCSDYKEYQGYLKQISLIFNKVLSRMDKGKNFLKLFSDELSKRTFTGSSKILVDDIKKVKEFYITCAKNINNLLNKNKIVEYNKKYMYHYKIKGSIPIVVKTSGTYINLQFSFKNASNTQNMLDFYDINNYFSNISNEQNYDTIVMSVPTNVFFSIPYEASNYTMKRGFLTVIKNSRIKKCGDYCRTCINGCKPTIINGSKRLEMILWA